MALRPGIGHHHIIEITVPKTMETATSRPMTIIPFSLRDRVRRLVRAIERSIEIGAEWPDYSPRTMPVAISSACVPERRRG